MGYTVGDCTPYNLMSGHEGKCGWLTAGEVVSGHLETLS